MARAQQIRHPSRTDDCDDDPVFDEGEDSAEFVGFDGHDVDVEACILMGGPDRWLIVFPDMSELLGDGNWQELPAHGLQIVGQAEQGWVLLRMPRWLFEQRAELRADRLREAQLERNRLAEQARQARRQHENQVARAKPRVVKEEPEATARYGREGYRILQVLLHDEAAVGRTIRNANSTRQ
jgi:hypothetical protein